MNIVDRLALAAAVLAMLLAARSASAHELTGPTRIALRQPIPLSTPDDANAPLVEPAPLTPAFPTLRVRLANCPGAPACTPTPPVCWPGPQVGFPQFAFPQHLRGRLFYDTGFFNHHPYNATLPPFDDAQALRSARLGAEGYLSQQLWYRAEFDFSNGDGVSSNLTSTVNIKDVFLQLNQLPFIGNFRAGHFREPFSLEQQTDQTFITFMERSVMDRGQPVFSPADQVQNTNADLVPGRSTGIMVQNAAFDSRLWGALGWFRVDSDNLGFDNGDGDYALTTRITGLPLWQENGRRLIHLGAAYSYREYRDPAPGGGNLPAYTSRVTTLGTPLLLNTGIIKDANRGANFGAEFAAVLGPLSFQAEFVDVHLDEEHGRQDLNYWGAYFYASWFLTGEHRRYNKCTAAFDRVIPLQNFVCTAGNPCDTKIMRILVGKGAWELAARYSIVDLSGGLFRPVNGLLPGNTTQSLEGGTGVLREWTFGLNWYWNPNARIMFNYVRTQRDSDSVGMGLVSSVLWRFQVDW